jgi:hypothetical protein
VRAAFAFPRDLTYYPNMRASKWPWVELDIPPRRAQLVRWGRDPDGDWHALLWWIESYRLIARDDVHGTRLELTAWTNAAHVRQLPDQDYSRIRRVELGANPARWGGVDGESGYWHHAGWHLTPIDGAEPIPPGYEPVVYGDWSPRSTTRPAGGQPSP